MQDSNGKRIKIIKRGGGICAGCKNSTMYASAGACLEEDKSGIVVIKNVPCLVCSQCGEKAFTPEVEDHLEQITEQARLLMQEVAVVDYARWASAYPDGMFPTKEAAQIAKTEHLGSLDLLPGSAAVTPDDFADKLQKYIDLTLQIKLLSSPRIDEIRDEEDYQKVLMNNFTRIGELSVDINAVLDQYLYPLLNSDEPLTREEARSLVEFSRKLNNARNMDNIDPSLCYLVAEKLLQDADLREDDEAIIEALDGMIEICYVMLQVGLRLSPCSDAGYFYRNVGLDAGKRLLAYLDKERFAALPNEKCKELVLVDSRYISALFHREDLPSDALNRQDMDVLIRSIELADDPFYAEQAPGYDWRYHTFRALQYITSLTERSNSRRCSNELIEEIYGYTQQLVALWESDEAYFSKYCPRDILDLYQARITYLSGRTTKNAYKKELRTLLGRVNPNRFTFHDNIVNLLVFDEYLLIEKTKSLAEEDAKALAEDYQHITAYVHRMPKIGSISYVTSLLADIIKDYVDIPGDSFDEMCMRLLLAMHPPTYVHSLTVAVLVETITACLLETKPEIFLGYGGFRRTKEIRAHKDEILAYAKRAALCHDVGKLFVMENVMTYGRYLTDEEFDLVQTHAEIGGHVLRQHEDTKRYASVAQYHHWHYEDFGTYLSDIPIDPAERPFIDITCCADCMDAATDDVGRSYKKGKSFDEFMEELETGSGTRYAPYVVELFLDEDMRDRFEKILSEAREMNYREAYKTLSRFKQD